MEKTEETIESKEAPHSCEINVSGKGIWSYKIKCYNENVVDAVNLAMIQAEKMELICKGKNKEV